MNDFYIRAVILNCNAYILKYFIFVLESGWKKINWFQWGVFFLNSVIVFLNWCGGILWSKLPVLILQTKGHCNKNIIIAFIHFIFLPHFFETCPNRHLSENPRWQNDESTCSYDTFREQTCNADQFLINSWSTLQRVKFQFLLTGKVDTLTHTQTLRSNLKDPEWAITLFIKHLLQAPLCLALWTLGKGFLLCSPLTGTNWSESHYKAGRDATSSVCSFFLFVCFFGSFRKFCYTCIVACVLMFPSIC